MQRDIHITAVYLFAIRGTREREKRVLQFTLSWRGSPKEASRLTENGLPQINK